MKSTHLSFFPLNGLAFLLVACASEVGDTTLDKGADSEEAVPRSASWDVLRGGSTQGADVAGTPRTEVPPSPGSAESNEPFASPRSSFNGSQNGSKGDGVPSGKTSEPSSQPPVMCGQPRYWEDTLNVHPLGELPKASFDWCHDHGARKGLASNCEADLECSQRPDIAGPNDGRVGIQCCGDLGVCSCWRQASYSHIWDVYTFKVDVAPVCAVGYGAEMFKMAHEICNAEGRPR